ncbi:putative sporulation protein YtxC [Bacillus sp. Marseille-P3661]|uniref:putative sporulation protein YtxC n=1 Tax=Bacillus sp. Marseille-P3661 TaxID=1936234 RepID=UPI000C8583D3|nr:putative sporulation protein YtxC [Bacillus sp. Marseille-P3661]
MITIQFREKKDAIIFYHQLKQFKHENAYNVDAQVIYEPEVLVKINLDKSYDTLIVNVIIPVLVQYILKVIEVRWMKEMIRNMFYFSDEEEQRQIMSVARSIIDGESHESSYISKDIELTREKMIEHALKNFLTKSVSFSFDAFLQFRLKDYRFRLLQYIEAAIDEYKLEQEYQNFIENLRSYVYRKEPLIDTIHLTFNKGSFTFYDNHFVELSSDHLKFIIDEQLMYMEDLDTESLVIAPLISIAPRIIYLYTDHLDYGLIQTIQNIFLERVVIRPKKDFFDSKEHFSENY